jgi:hypothetical protein
VGSLPGVKGIWVSRSAVQGTLPPTCSLPIFAEPRGLVVLNAPVLCNLQEQQVTDLLVDSAACHPDLLQEHLLARMTPEDANNKREGVGIREGETAQTRN